MRHDDEFAETRRLIQQEKARRAKAAKKKAQRAAISKERAARTAATAPTRRKFSALFGYHRARVLRDVLGARRFDVLAQTYVTKKKESIKKIRERQARAVEKAIKEQGLSRKDATRFRERERVRRHLPEPVIYRSKDKWHLRLGYKDVRTVDTKKEALAWKAKQKYSRKIKGLAKQLDMSEAEARSFNRAFKTAAVKALEKYKRSKAYKALSKRKQRAITRGGALRGAEWALDFIERVLESI